MSNFNVEQSREIRLWVTRVGIPLLIGTAAILSNEELRGKIKHGIWAAEDKFHEVKTNLKERFAK